MSNYYHSAPVTISLMGCDKTFNSRVDAIETLFALGVYGSDSDYEEARKALNSLFSSEKVA